MRSRLLLLYCLLMSFGGSAAAQISPGKLSRSHAKLEGMTNCTQCHERGDIISSNKCLACHIEIRQSMDTRHGFHFLNEASPCIDCHKEHLGYEAGITRFDKNKFDHTGTGFTLTDRHASIQCGSCHAADKITNAAVLKSLKEYPRQTYLGIQGQCPVCHMDRHAGTLGTDCRNCHDARGWKPAALFAHSKTKFPLSGKHNGIACAQCHPSMQVNDRTKPLLFVLNKFDDCNACHPSPHSRRLSNESCKSCHIADGWTAVAGFDHSRTAFSLIGKHSSVTCSKCHPDMKQRGRIAKQEFKTSPFQDCSPCHTSPHTSAFSQKTCSSCHTPLQWTAVSEKTFDHSLTSFPLRGKHSLVECRKCHGSKGKQSFTQSFRMLKKACPDCHEDTHKGAFRIEYANDCSRCHNEEAYVPSTYTADQHQHSRFPLTGGHAAIPCRGCHLKQGDLVFLFDRASCESCHKDKHQGRFASVMKERSCDACHTTEVWKKVIFDHDKTDFPLTGKHTSAACDKCHMKKTGSAGPLYKGMSTACSGCHADPHRGQFSDTGGEACSGCHATTGWKNLIFDHNVRSSFPLTGAHAKVQCSSCHPPEQQEGNLFIRYKPLASKCESCHQGKI